VRFLTEHLPELFERETLTGSGGSDAGHRAPHSITRARSPARPCGRATPARARDPLNVYKKPSSISHIVISMAAATRSSGVMPS